MKSRFVSNLLVIFAASLLLAASLGFGISTLSWIALGVGVVVCMTVLVAFACRGRGHDTTRARRVGLDPGRTDDRGIPLLRRRRPEVAGVLFGRRVVHAGSGGLVAHEVLNESSLERSVEYRLKGRVGQVAESASIRVAR